MTALHSAQQLLARVKMPKKASAPKPFPDLEPLDRDALEPGLYYVRAWALLSEKWVITVAEVSGSGRWLKVETMQRMVGDDMEFLVRLPDPYVIKAHCYTQNTGESVLQ